MDVPTATPEIPPPDERWRLEVDGRRIEVAARSKGMTSRAWLFLDGREVAAGKAGHGEAKLRGDGVEVKVRWGWGGGVRSCLAKLPAVDGKPAATLPLHPPPGSRAARIEERAEQRPVLYAARHVVLAAAQILLPLLGIGALIGLVLPAIPLPDVSLPEVSVDLPDLRLPSISLPDVTLPGWVRAILDSAKWWGPLLFALAIGAQEVDRRRRRREREDAGSAEGDR